MSHHVPAVRHIGEHALNRPVLGFLCKAAVGTDDFADLAADLGTVLVPQLQQHGRNTSETTAYTFVHSPRCSHEMLSTHVNILYLQDPWA